VIRAWWWVLLFGVIGFVISALFAGVLGLKRDAVVLGYLIVTLPLMVAFFRRSPAAARALSRNRAGGIVGGLVLGAVLAITVLRQPGSEVPSGSHLVIALLWLGLVYGVLDALLLTVLPVLAVKDGGEPEHRSGRLWRSGAALAASLWVTAAYHFGYPEFRGSRLVGPVIGNAIITTGYLLTGSAATPLIGHVMMHGAAVLHGMDTAAQLPPHYE
jgi:hypothetical protein